MKSYNKKIIAILIGKGYYQNMKGNLESNIWKYYALSVLGGLAYFYNAIDTLYYKHFDLSLEQIGFLFSATLLFGIILEVPSGAFADIYGRKKAIIIANVFSMLGVGSLFIASEFYHFLIGFSLLGVGGAFISGALQALLFDTLRSSGKEKNYIKYISRNEALFVSIDIISGFFGPLLFAAAVRLPFGIAFGFSVVALLLSLSLVEVNDQTKTHQRGVSMQIFLKIISDAFNFIFKNTTFLWFMIFTVFLTVSGRMFAEMLSSPYLAEIFTLEELAIPFSISAVIQAGALLYVEKIERILKINKSIISSIVLLALAIFLFISTENLILISLVLGLYYAVASFIETVNEDAQNKLIPEGANRATILSMVALTSSIFSLILFPFMGYLLDEVGNNRDGLLILSIGTLLVGGLLYLSKRFVISK